MASIASTPLVASLSKNVRLEDLLAAATAVPLPDTPSTQPHETLPDTTPPVADEKASAAEDHIQFDASVSPTISVGNEHPTVAPEQDAVQHSLQATLDTIRHSLNEERDGSAGPIHAASAATGLALNDVQDASASSAPVVLSHDAGAEIPLATGGENLSSPSTIDAPSQTLDALGPTLDPALAALGHVAAAADMATTLSGNIIQSTIGAADAVTIPSLGGVGFDSMAGLIQPPAAPALAPMAADALHGFAAAVPIFDAIGAQQVGGVDHELAHLAHDPAHQIGGGLI